MPRSAPCAPGPISQLPVSLDQRHCIALTTAAPAAGAAPSSAPHAAAASRRDASLVAAIGGGGPGGGGPGGWAGAGAGFCGRHGCWAGGRRTPRRRRRAPRRRGRGPCRSPGAAGRGEGAGGLAGGARGSRRVAELAGGGRVVEGRGGRDRTDCGSGESEELLRPGSAPIWGGGRWETALLGLCALLPSVMQRTRPKNAPQVRLGQAAARRRAPGPRHPLPGGRAAAQAQRAAPVARLPPAPRAARVAAAGWSVPACAAACVMKVNANV
jgi:hypothetical protein